MKIYQKLATLLSDWETDYDLREICSQKIKSLVQSFPKKESWIRELVLTSASSRNELFFYVRNPEGSCTVIVKPDMIDELQITLIGDTPHLQSNIEVALFGWLTGSADK